MRGGMVRQLGAALVALSIVATACSSSDESVASRRADASPRTDASPQTDATVRDTAAPASTDADTTDAPLTLPVRTDPPTTVDATPDTTATTPPDPTTDPTTAPSDAPAATAPFDSLVPFDRPAACAFTPAVGYGEVTWVQDGQLLALAGGHQPTCLLDGVDGSELVAWSSDAGRVLVGAAAISADGGRDTGFDPALAPIELSAPTGTASISVVGGRLIRHATNGAASDISFIDRTDEAIYHPGGKRIVAVGAFAGRYGIWLSSNTGGATKQILDVADPSVPVTGLRFSADGLTLYFVHGFVHRLYVPDLVLSEIGKADRVEANLVASLQDDDAVAYTTGPCDGSGTLEVHTGDYLGDLRAEPDFPVAPDAGVRPVGWLSGNRLVFASGAPGCGGPVDVWIWSQADGYHHVAANASAPAVRTPRGPFQELPNLIEEAAPG